MPKQATEGFNDEGFWAGEGNAASGVLLICPATGRIGLAWRSPDVHIGDCWGVVGGAVKKGMTPQESAKEELGEETGYRGGITLHPAFVFHAD
jgi:8-oxo-dGTP pyrophosphatase MutT (NUDIX family)